MNTAEAAVAATPITSRPGKLKVINLWAGPGAGKSTLACAIFNLMKRERFECELVTEVAKGLTYDRSFTELGNQTLVLARQEHQLRRLIGQVEYAVVDSPFPLGLIYCNQDQKGRYQHLIDELWDDYENYSFSLKRTSKAYQQFGRSQTLEESMALDVEIADLAAEYGSLDLPVIDADDPTSEYRVLNAVLAAQGLPTMTERMTEQVDG